MNKKLVYFFLRLISGALGVFFISLPVFFIYDLTKVIFGEGAKFSLVLFWLFSGIGTGWVCLVNLTIIFDSTHRIKLFSSTRKSFFTGLGFMILYLAMLSIIERLQFEVLQNWVWHIYIIVLPILSFATLFILDLFIMSRAK